MENANYLKKNDKIYSLWANCMYPKTYTVTKVIEKGTLIEVHYKDDKTYRIAYAHKHSWFLSGPNGDIYFADKDLAERFERRAINAEKYEGLIMDIKSIRSLSDELGISITATPIK